MKILCRTLDVNVRVYNHNFSLLNFLSSVCHGLVLKEKIEEMRWKDTDNKPQSTSSSLFFVNMGMPCSHIHSILSEMLHSKFGT
jgi:hypothetical protein